MGAWSKARKRLTAIQLLLTAEPISKEVMYFGVFQIGLAYAVDARHPPTGVEATTLLMLEPALSPLWAWLVHLERPGGLWRAEAWS